MRLEVVRMDKAVDLPAYAHPGDAAFDLRASESAKISPGEKVIVKTGLKTAIPEGYFGNIRDRSGLAAKHALHVLAGVIDSGYRGEIGVVMVNLGREEFRVEKNDRIAQMLIQPVVQVDIREVTSLDSTKRDAGGFGSTGTK